MFIPEVALAAAHVVHVAVRQRNGKKAWTAIWGIPSEMSGYGVDFPKLLRAMKKIFRTNGTFRMDKQRGAVIQLQGDCSKAVKYFLVHQCLAPMPRSPVS